MNFCVASKMISTGALEKLLINLALDCEMKKPSAELFQEKVMLPTVLELGCRDLLRLWTEMRRLELVCEYCKKYKGLKKAEEYVETLCYIRIRLAREVCREVLRCFPNLACENKNKEKNEFAVHIAWVLRKR
ncbi:MAG: hypothetical protein IJO93_05390 [Clostridia bacterium]|nr:hypothetical protein [Clostridia bacterium]